MKIGIIRLLSFFLVLIIACGEQTDRQENQHTPVASELPGSVLAVQYCGSCHAFVGPDMLPKSIWEKDVLPSMGHRLGIYKGKHQPDSLFDKGVGGDLVRKANIYPEKAVLAVEDWEKIFKYYLEQAPDTIPPPIREKSITVGLKHFKYRKSPFAHKPPLTSMINILPKGRGIVFGDGKQNQSNLTFLDVNLEKDMNITLRTTPIHFREKADTIYLTTIGKSIYPHDAPDGNILKVFKKGTGQPYSNAKVLLPDLQRPVDMLYGDLNGDGLADIVACQYGNLTGKLVWYQNQGDHRYAMRTLNGMPGAIKVSLADLDEDGLMDIIALMAQGDEGLFWYRNLGNGNFTETRLLSFLPLNGSQYFELKDFNGDGKLDILYVCGDNADQTPILKPYHGIYIYLNDGKNRFEQSYFYALNGAYKAMANDYDLDGDLDIAAISFFPDYARYPEESFVYLENTGNGVYKDYSFIGATDGRWIVMDAADMDEDGDIDIALGSFVGFLAKDDTTGLSQRWLDSSPSVVVLENTIK